MEKTVLKTLFDQIHPTDEQTMRIFQKITQTNSSSLNDQSAIRPEVNEKNKQNAYKSTNLCIKGIGAFIYLNLMIN